MNELHGGNIYHYSGLSPDEILDFSANINPLPYPPSAAQAIQDAFHSLRRYPDLQEKELRQSIANYEKLPQELIQTGNGAADLLFRIVAALSPKKAAIITPTFSEYDEAVRAIGAERTFVLLSRDNDFAPDEEILNKIPPKTDLLFLCSPNNPTGKLASLSLIEKLLKKGESEGFFLLLDESFMDFREDCREKTASPLLHKYHNLIILKSLTKFLGIAGARIGYSLCADLELTEKLKQRTPPWMINIFAQKLAVTLLKEQDFQKTTRKWAAEESKWLYNRLREFEGIHPYVPGCNFIFLEVCGNSKPDLKNQLLKTEKILIRQCAEYQGLSKNDYRVCVSLRENNERLLAGLKNILLK